MKQFFDFLFVFILMAGMIFVCIYLAWLIGESDLPLWIKLLLLK